MARYIHIVCTSLSSASSSVGMPNERAIIFIYRAKRLSAKNTHEEIWILNTIMTLFSFVKLNYMWNTCAALPKEGDRGASGVSDLVHAPGTP